MERISTADSLDGLFKKYLVVSLDDERRRVAAAGVAGEAHLVFLARHQAGDHLAQRAAPLQEGDQVLVFSLAVVGERAGPVEVDTIVPGARPAGDRLGLDVAGPRRRTAGLEAGIHHDDITLVALHDRNGIQNQRGISPNFTAKNQLCSLGLGGEHNSLAEVSVCPTDRLELLVPGQFLTIQFHDQADGGIAAAVAAVVVELQPILFFRIQASEHLGDRTRALAERHLVTIRRGAIVIEWPADVDTTAAGPAANRAVVRPSSGGRVRLKTRIHHESRALGQEDRVANTDTRVNRQAERRLATAKHRHVHRLGVWPSLGKSKRDRAVGVVIGDGYAWVAAGQRDAGVSVLNQANRHLDSDLRGVVAGTKVSVDHRGRDTGVSDHLEVVERVFEVSAVAKQRDVVRVETTLLGVLH